MNISSRNTLLNYYYYTRSGISFLRNSDGTAAGGCFVEFLSPEDVKLALAKDKQYMGNRFCHVSRASLETRDSELTKQETGGC